MHRSKSQGFFFIILVFHTIYCAQVHYVFLTVQVFSTKSCHMPLTCICILYVTLDYLIYCLALLIVNWAPWKIRNFVLNGIGQEKKPLWFWSIDF